MRMKNLLRLHGIVPLIISCGSMELTPRDSFPQRLNEARQSSTSKTFSKLNRAYSSCDNIAPQVTSRSGTAVPADTREGPVITMTPCPVKPPCADGRYYHDAKVRAGACAAEEELTTSFMAATFRLTSRSHPIGSPSPHHTPSASY
jgi:hypothetical protein